MYIGYQTRMHVLIEELNTYIQNEEVYGKRTIIQEFKKIFPDVDNKDLDKIIELFIIQDMKFNSKRISAEFVTTIPAQLQGMGSRSTIGVLREYIHAAEHTILITG